MLVVKPDSSTKTRLSISRPGCSSRQASRLALTSGLSCSDACRVFFKAPADMPEIAVKPRPAGLDPPLAEIRNQLGERCIGPRLQELPHHRVTGRQLVS